MAGERVELGAMFSDPETPRLSIPKPAKRLPRFTAPPGDATFCFIYDVEMKCVLVDWRAAAVVCWYENEKKILICCQQ